jgi:alcohol dehydrogenase class IV
VIETLELFREIDADAVVSVGGGSCSDAGKLCALPLRYVSSLQLTSAMLHTTRCSSPGSKRRHK